MAREQTQRQSEQVTGVSNVAYDLMAVLYNKLEGVAAMEEYKLDAEDSGDQEAWNLFDQIEKQEAQHIEQLRKLLVQRLSA